jgi:hypothetical protein
MSRAQHLASKFRRAIRNDTGTHFSADEMRQLGEWGILNILIEREAEELSTKWQGRNSGSTRSGHSGLPSPARTVAHPISKSAGMTKQREQAAAKALAAQA